MLHAEIREENEDENEMKEEDASIHVVGDEDDEMDEEDEEEIPKSQWTEPPSMSIGE